MNRHISGENQMANRHMKSAQSTLLKGKSKKIIKTIKYFYINKRSGKHSFKWTYVPFIVVLSTIAKI